MFLRCPIHNSAMNLDDETTTKAMTWWYGLWVYKTHFRWCIKWISNTRIFTFCRVIARVRRRRKWNRYSALALLLARVCSCKVSAGAMQRRAGGFISHDIIVIWYIKEGAIVTTQGSAIGLVKTRTPSNNLQCHVSAFTLRDPIALGRICNEFSRHN